MCSETVECNVLLGPQFINYLNQVYTALCLNLKYFWCFFSCLLLHLVIMGEICQIFHDSGVYFSLFCQVLLCTCGIVWFLWSQI